MKIAFITYEFPPFIIGGAGIYAKYLTQNLAERGHQVNVFSPEIVKNNSMAKSGIDNIETIKVRTYNKIPFKSIQFYLQLPKIMKKIEKENNFDIIHFNGISYWFFKKRISKAPHVITIHHLVKDAIKSNNLSLFSRVKDITGETSFIIPFIEKRSIKSSDGIISVSNFTKNQIVKTYGISSDKIDVVYNGIDSGIYNFTKKEIEEIRHKLKIDKKPVILFVGRADDPRKDIEFLLRVFKKITEKTDVILLVVGSGNQNSAKKIVSSLKLSKDVIFTGFVDSTTLKKIYALCTLYVCSSRLEGFGLTITEAMAAGKPIVATNVGGIPEVVKDKRNGLLVEVNDKEKFAEAMDYFLENQDIASKVGNYNKKYVNERFSWAKNARETEKIYRSLLR
jgi:glycosyltransferase involved in cell wall biosynthesis